MVKKIMHVEDDADTRKAVKLILEEEGYDVISAFSGKVCLNKLKEEKPDLMLIDMMMPDMTGWDLFQKIKKIKKLESTKIAFLSVVPILEEKKQEMYKRGIVDYIMKPFTDEELLEKIKEMMVEKAEKRKRTLTIKDFIPRIEYKDNIKILSEIIVNILLLQTIKNNDYIRNQDIIKQILSKLQTLASSDLNKSLLFQYKIKVIKRKETDNMIKKELISKFKVLVNPNSLSRTFFRFEKEGLVKSKIINRNKTYKLTKKGNNGINLLLEHFLKLYK